MLDARLPATTGVPFARDLAQHGDRTALVVAGREVSYLELAGLVADAGRALGTERRLVLLAGDNALEPLVVHLAALAGGHPVLLVPGDDPARLADLVATYRPDTTYSAERGLEHLHAEPVHDLHPELALLLSTSGSTGSPKLVRLSADNLQANAESIATYLAIRDTDRAATTLPMHYCYGLSVLHSHLLRGATVLLTDLSVVDACFWELFREQRGTTFAGVPYTFDLLDRVGFADMDLPHLRYVTQAGGRLDPEKVRRFAELGHRRGWDLFVMYGQTEATARIAYLPPDLALTAPHAIGVPVPGGSLRVDEDGELVYRGPNVMLGYAERPADLALGRTVDELRTGDLARQNADGLFELVGRRSRFVKVLGLRIDLDRVEAATGACCTGTDGEIVVAVEPGQDVGATRRRVAAAAGVPARAVRAVSVGAVPRTASGKPDRRVLRTDLRALYAEVLERDDVTEDSTFVGLGGDSLSYVEMSVRLEAALGSLPPSWHTTPIRDLRPGRRSRTLDTTVALRAVAILLIVGTHANLFDLSGGAHVLLGIAGYNFARFHLARSDRTRGLLTSIARIVVPSVLWIGLAAAITDRYSVANVLLLNGVVGADGWSSAWHYWFLEALVHLLLAVTALLAIPAVQRLERRHALPFATGVLTAGLAARYVFDGPNAVHTVPGVLWLFAVGWVGALVTTTRQRALLTAVLAVATVGYFTDPRRGAFVVAGLALMIWVPAVRSSARVSRIAGVLAASSLYVYVTHWLVYPHLEDRVPILAAAASFAVGIAYWQLSRRMARITPERARSLVRLP